MVSRDENSLLKSGNDGAHTCGKLSCFPVIQSRIDYSRGSSVGVRRSVPLGNAQLPSAIYASSSRLGSTYRTLHIPILPRTMSEINKAKRAAAHAAVDEYVTSGQVVGVGSGSTVVFAAERLRERTEQDGLDVICIPSSFQALQLIRENSLKLGDLSQNPEIDVSIDGADEVDSKLNCIKGGGGCHLQEKILISNAKKFVIVADYTKKSEVLGQKWQKGIPVEVLPMAYIPIMRRLEKMGGSPTLRMAKSKAGPVVSDSGNFIIDVHFGEISDPDKLERELLYIPGVLEVGLFNGLAEKAFFGNADGSFEVVSAPSLK